MLQQQQRQFIIYLIVSNNKLNNDDKRPYSKTLQQPKPIGLIQSQEVFGGDDRNMLDQQQQTGPHILIKQLDSGNFSSSFLEKILYKQDFNLIHFESENSDRNLLELSMEGNVNKHKYHWLIRPPCVVLINAIIHIHIGGGSLSTFPEIIYGLKEIFLTDEAQLCFYASSDCINNMDDTKITTIINLYTKSNLVKRIVSIEKDRRQEIASIFYSNFLKLINNFSIFSSTFDEIYMYKMEKSESIRRTDCPEFLIYFDDRRQKKPVALLHGNIELSKSLDNSMPRKECLIKANFNLGQILQIPDSVLELQVIIDEKTRKDRQYICKHWSLIRVNFMAEAFVHSLNPLYQFKVLPKSSITIAGYVGLIEHNVKDSLNHLNASKLISGGDKNNLQEISIKEKCLVFIGNHFMLLMLMEKELKKSNTNDNHQKNIEHENRI